MQQSVDRPRPQQERTLTLGPGAPIHDWEVERVTVKGPVKINLVKSLLALCWKLMNHHPSKILAEHKEYRERAEKLEKQLQQDRETYERNTASVSWMLNFLHDSRQVNSYFLVATWS